MTSEYSDIQGAIIVKRASVTINISSIGEAGYVYVPYPEVPEGYIPFLPVPSSGGPNVLVANTQFAPYSQWQSTGIPIRYIGYQRGNWPIVVYFYYIKQCILDVQE